MCADIRIAADNAVLGQPEILLGIIPGAGGTQRLTRLVGPSKAKDLIFTGRFVKADEALAIGLVDKVVPAEDVYTQAVAWARQFTGAASYAVRAAKESIDRGLEVDLETGLELERQQFAALFATEDRGIGMTSFVEQGPGKAEFVGR
jgi:enoyl-CoA hydratase/carnithine racemase